LDAIGVYPFQTGDGWKVFDVTPFIKSKQGQVGHGLMFRYINEELPSSGEWNGYQLVSREGNQEWAAKRPRFLVVESPAK
jgi:hypothetical protein